MELDEGIFNKKINKDNHTPYYIQFKEIIIDLIEREIYKDKQKLPSEKELTDHFGISRITIRKAFNELENEGYIKRIQGKGTYVSHKKFKQDLLSFYSFTEEMKKQGKRPSSIVLDFETIKVDSKIASKMKINVGDEAYKFTRLRLADETPMMLETTYLPYNLFPGIEKKDIENNPLYYILKQKYKVYFSKAVEIFSSTSLTEYESKKLDSKKGRPTILLERWAYANDDIVEYTKSVIRGDKFKFKVVLPK